jgi:(p)ppGpp synthase/HD superfamily hydrolase
MLSSALQVATQAHAGQVDKGGKPYIRHPLAVSALVDTEQEKIVALLHDVVEDTAVTLENLRSFGFSEDILTAVDCITKRQGEPLESYLQRVKSNPLATAVKTADLSHNSDISRIPNPTQKDVARLERYKQAAAYLAESP